MVMDALYKVNCNDAWNISIELDQAKANELSSAGYWSDQDRIRKTIRFRVANNSSHCLLFSFYQFKVLCFLNALDLGKCLTLVNFCRFGIKGSGLTYEAKFNWANWTQPVKNWVCGYEPYLGVVIYDCIPEDKVPLWWDDSYLGPKFDDGELELWISPLLLMLNAGVPCCFYSCILNIVIPWRL